LPLIPRRSTAPDGTVLLNCAYACLPEAHGIEREVELLERLEFAKGRSLDAPADQPLGADGQLILEDQLQKLRVVEPVARGFL
jgi:hypothetical protein